MQDTLDKFWKSFRSFDVLQVSCWGTPGESGAGGPLTQLVVLRNGSVARVGLMHWQARLEHLRM
eukprot:1056994-Amphidinium_carterae.1